MWRAAPIVCALWIHDIGAGYPHWMSTCVSVIGPAKGDSAALDSAISAALADANVRQVIYLGDDDAARNVVERILATGIAPSNFLSHAVDAAVRGDASQIRALLNDEARGRRLAAVRSLPAPPARAIELLDRWVLLAVHDKAVLDEDDIANAQVILYGKSEGPTLKRFGQHFFFSPGSLTDGCTGMLIHRDDGSLVLELRDLSGAIQRTETLTAGSSKFRVKP